MTIDRIDQLVLDSLKENSKLVIKELASKIGLSVTPTYERIKKLEKSGIIKGYTAKLNNALLGKGLKVYCQVSLSSHQSDLIDGFEQTVIQFPEVVTFHHIAGSIDYILYIETKDMEAYHHFLRNNLATISGIGNVQSSFVLRTLKE